MSANISAKKPNVFLNILYLLLAFPLGTLYFMLLMTGFLLAIGLFITWVGVPVLLTSFAIVWALSTFERHLAIWLLGINIPEATPPNTTGQTIWSRVRTYLFNIDTWKRLAYLLAKLPLGLLSFSVVIILIALTVLLIITPVIYNNPNLVLVGGIRVLEWKVDTLSKALLFSALGIVVGVVSMYVINGLAFISGKFIRLMFNARLK